MVALLWSSGPDGVFLAAAEATSKTAYGHDEVGMSENGVQTPNEIAIFSRDNDQQNHWVQWGTLFSEKPK